MTLVDLRRHASDQGLSQPAMQAIAEHLGRRTGHRVLEPPRLRADAVLQCLRLGRALRALRRAHDAASAGGAIALPSLRRAGTGAAAAAAAATAAARRPGHRARRGDLQRLFRRRRWRGSIGTRPACAAASNPCSPGAQRRGAHSGRHPDAHQGASFPDVSLVVILDADQGLFASDYRATERLAQTIIQVAAGPVAMPAPARS
jgi:primosomal protein N' (replication factor Y) (superfamily II helicase)